MGRFCLVTAFTVLALTVNAQWILYLNDGRSIKYKKKLKAKDAFYEVKDVDRITHQISKEEILARCAVNSGQIEYFMRVPDPDEGRELLDLSKRREYFFLKSKVEGKIKIFSREIQKSHHSPGFGGAPGSTYYTSYNIYYLAYDTIIERISFNEKKLIKSKKGDQKRIEDLQELFAETINDGFINEQMMNNDFAGTFSEVKKIVLAYNLKYFEPSASEVNREISFIRTPQYFESEPVSISVNDELVLESFEVGKSFVTTFPIGVPFKLCADYYCEIVTIMEGVEYNLDIIYDPELKKYSFSHLDDYNFSYWKKGLDRKNKKAKN